MANGSHLLPALAGLSLVIWIVLIFFRRGFWLCRERLSAQPWDGPAPPVAVLVPARNEAAVIEETLTSLLHQIYAGPMIIMVIDDQSEDDTANRVQAMAASQSGNRDLRLIGGQPPEAGWTGKLWALQQGLEEISKKAEEPVFYWFSDADIAHRPDTLSQLVAKAEGDKRDLVSLMATLFVSSFWERLLIPPFIYFFQKLYPFGALNDPTSRQGGAAGGCLLVRREALKRAGGLSAMGSALIDDCTLGALIKSARQGESRGIWVGLSEGQSRSIRPYRGLGDLWRMVTRSAYTQLRHSPLLLLGTLIGMIATYLLAPVLVLSWPWHQQAIAALPALLAWMLMTMSLLPVLRLYRLSPLWALSLPVAAFLYSLMTFDSALRHWRGAGGEWKGRPQAALDRPSRQG